MGTETTTVSIASILVMPLPSPIFAKSLLLHLAEIFQNARPVDPLVRSRLEVHRRSNDLDVLEGTLGVEVGDIDSHAVDALIEPEEDGLLPDRLPDFRIGEVEIRLADDERVEVVLLGRLVPLPG